MASLSSCALNFNEKAKVKVRILVGQRVKGTGLNRPRPPLIPKPPLSTSTLNKILFPIGLHLLIHKTNPAMASDDSGVMDLTRNIMMVSVIALFTIVIFLLFLHLYSKWYWYRRQQAAMANHQQRGIDASFLKTIEFHANDFQHGLECAICLSDLEEGDRARILPKCNHGFHMECIDMWFHSHSTCPICRDEISQQQSPTQLHVSINNDNNHQLGPSPSASSSSSLQEDRGIRPHLVIDIPSAQHNQQEEEQVVSSTRSSSGMRSLKRIFSPSTSSNSNAKSPTPNTISTRV
ncbi:hypothetical protein OSB04_030377 [Centaurea solstitialis]|uniref:RING-type domain-containing protein n=1 Tax=Centaurea solstitialis TaxID=347529 RepID=A0AA38S6T0_9ASTR|nr:hypothetical protein OSB04_030377 [Centaurea solstitialis]